MQIFPSWVHFFDLSAQEYYCHGAFLDIFLLLYLLQGLCIRINFVLIRRILLTSDRLDTLQLLVYQTFYTKSTIKTLQTYVYVFYRCKCKSICGSKFIIKKITTTRNYNCFVCFRCGEKYHYYSLSKFSCK